MALPCSTAHSVENLTSSKAQACLFARERNEIPSVRLEVFATPYLATPDSDWLAVNPNAHWPVFSSHPPMFQEFFPKRSLMRLLALPGTDMNTPLLSALGQCYLVITGAKVNILLEGERNLIGLADVVGV